ncbi:ABC transporter ATP-binding protein [Chondromyces apiculatus]|uniref:ABC transporter involved in cytochrome c biogenesis, ATPase component CcmA n=1 Tax=Chondromyces apiculatus DSM 436 TaxID=1192034 RepID=A0A017T2Z6_9BACT|nr:ABC transporter ATP-binding protein [Chondromyces apiculatus]EYF03588.1 ABC transporter involved in cytochrome c biogenesis, ATPase component CcmA [Chondromyces apiculatus DSM 436]
MTSEQQAEGHRIERVVARGLVKTFGSTVALRGVHATIDTARLTLIEGANGSGKSTFLGILGTVIRPTSGTVTYAPHADDRALARRSIGWLSHESLAYPDLTGRQNIELAARLHGLSAQTAWREAEERFELGNFATRPLRTCSRGQRQRIALARALVHRPSLVLLDEPTTGLDRPSVARLLDLVVAEVKRGAGVVVVSHEPDLFRDLATARIVLERGRNAVSAPEASTT